MSSAPYADLFPLSSTLTRRDRLRHLGYRWGLGRMHAAVRPGLYALNSPGPDAPVLVSANYRLSFDILRAALIGRRAWLLVADTHGINVWCAAGKGTLSAEAVAEQVSATGLKDRVSHRRLVLPQLSAPGVAAHRVKELSGFTARFGPVRATDLPAFLDSGGAAPAMRRVTFTLPERAVLAPMELTLAVWPLLFAAVGVWLLAGPAAALVFWLTGLSATLALPLLHDALPGRWCSVKGLAWGALASALLSWALVPDWRRAVPGVLVGMAVASYLGLNFTGATTYTSVNGVKREMRRMLPVMIVLAVVGLGGWVWGVMNGTR